MLVKGFCSDGTCRPSEFGTAKQPTGTGGGIPSSTGVQISASVGQSGKNLQPDVQTIQDALNRISPLQGGAAPQLVVDGLCGPKTKSAIQKLQLKHFGWSLADSRVDPGGPTLAKINELLGTSKFTATEDMDIGMSSSSELVGELGPPNKTNPLYLEYLDETLQWIRAAQANAMVAQTVVNQPPDAPGTSPLFSRAQRMELINRHFAIDKMPQAQRLSAVTRVLAIFGLMQSVFARPGGLWGVFILQNMGPTTKSPFLAETTLGGYYNSSQTMPDGRRADAIYANPKYFQNFVRPRLGVPFTVVHELAHFVGSPDSSEGIDDFGYGAPLGPKMKNLSPATRLRNANNFSNFAYEARHGIHEPVLNPIAYMEGP